MIIIKIIILYFIQIRHSEEFPSTGTRLILSFLTARASATNKVTASRRGLAIKVKVRVICAVGGVFARRPSTLGVASDRPFPASPAVASMKGAFRPMVTRMLVIFTGL